MIRVTSNIGQVARVNITHLKTLSDTDKMLRTAATTVLGLMKQRIHQDGKDASNTQIGTYSPEYMKVRTGNFGNSGRISRGVNEGTLKNSGVFSKGKHKGEQRPKYNRTGDTKVILSLTRQMENDMKVIPLQNNSYGIGYTNPLNFEKSQWCEATYDKEGKIFSLSENEIEQVNIIVDQFTKNALPK